jgi:hypothetical protein
MDLLAASFVAIALFNFASISFLRFFVKVQARGVSHAMVLKSS